MDGKIYFIRNEVNGMGYVGQTTQPGDRRFLTHLSCARCHSESARLIDRVIAQVGEDCIRYEVLETGIASIAELNEREAFWIAQKGTLWPNGYNRTTGGRNNNHAAMRLVVDSEIVELYQEGLTVQQVADRKHCSRTKVLNHLHAAGMSARPRAGRKYPGRKSRRRKFKLTRDEVVRLIRKGATYDDIAELGGVTRGSVPKIMRQMKTRYIDLLN